MRSPVIKRTISVGDTVRITNRDSVNHRMAAGMKVVGTVEKIDPSHYVGTHARPYIIKFEGEIGTASFNGNEIRKD